MLLYDYSSLYKSQNKFFFWFIAIFLTFETEKLRGFFFESMITLICKVFVRRFFWGRFGFFFEGFFEEEKRLRWVNFVLLFYRFICRLCVFEIDYIVFLRSFLKGGDDLQLRLVFLLLNILLGVVDV